MKTAHFSAGTTYVIECPEPCVVTNAATGNPVKEGDGSESFYFTPAVSAQYTLSSDAATFAPLT